MRTLVLVLALVGCASRVPVRPKAGAAPAKHLDATPAAWVAAAHYAKRVWQPPTKGLQALLACAARDKGAPCVPGFAAIAAATEALNAPGLTQTPASGRAGYVKDVEASLAKPFFPRDACSRVAAARARRILRAGWCARSTTERPGSAGSMKVTHAVVDGARKALAGVRPKAKAEAFVKAVASLEGKTVVGAGLKLLCRLPGGNELELDYDTLDGIPTGDLNFGVVQPGVQYPRDYDCDDKKAAATIAADLHGPAPAPSLDETAAAERAARIAGWAPLTRPEVAAFARCAAAGKGATCLPFAKRYFGQGGLVSTDWAPDQVAKGLPILLADTPLAGKAGSCRAKRFGLLAKWDAAGGCVYQARLPSGSTPDTLTVGPARRKLMDKVTTGTIRKRVDWIPAKGTQASLPALCVSPGGKSVLHFYLDVAVTPGGFLPFAMGLGSHAFDGPGDPCARGSKAAHAAAGR